MSSGPGKPNPAPTCRLLGPGDIHLAARHSSEPNSGSSAYFSGAAPARRCPQLLLGVAAKLGIAMRLKFVTYDRRFLLASRAWLRDPEIAALTMTPAFSDEDQERWFNELPKKTHYLVWGVELEGKPVGVFGLKGIGPERAEYFGYLGEKTTWGCGYGSEMVETALAAAKARGCSLVTLRVWRENPRAIALYRRLGFELVGESGHELHMERHV